MDDIPGTARVIWTAEPFETIVSVVSYRGRALIATDRRILEWKPDVDAVYVLDFVYVNPPDEASIVMAAQRSEF